MPFGAISRAGQYQRVPFFSCFNPDKSSAKFGNETLMNNDLWTEISSNGPWMRFDAISTRNCNFQRQVPGNCSDKEPYFLPDNQRITAFALFDRDVSRDGIPVKNRRFLSEISLTLATPCRDNLTSNYPDFWKNANNHTIRERDTKFPEKIPAALGK